MAEKIYVYTMTAKGELRERSGIIVKKNGKFNIVALPNGQRICVSSSSGKIHNNVMWSKTLQKNVYIQRMIEILLDRREDYQSKLESVTRRLNILKESR